MKIRKPEMEVATIIVHTTYAQGIKGIVSYKLHDEVKVYDTVYGRSYLVLEGPVEGFIRLKELAKIRGYWLNTNIVWEKGKVQINSRLSQEEFERAIAR